MRKPQVNGAAGEIKENLPFRSYPPPYSEWEPQLKPRTAFLPFGLEVGHSTAKRRRRL